MFALFSTGLSVAASGWMVPVPFHNMLTEAVIAGAAGFILLGLFLLRRELAGMRRSGMKLQKLAEQLEDRVKLRTEELLKANESLAANRELQAVTLASIGDGVITTDANARITYMNPEAERLTGWKNAEAEGQEFASVFYIVGGPDRTTVEDPARAVLSSGKSMALPTQSILVARDGKEIPIADSGAPIRDANGKVLGVVLVFRDCTVQRDAEKALRERVAVREQLAKVAASAPGVICSFQQGPDGRTTFPYASPGIEKLFGISPQELARDGSAVFERIQPEDLAYVKQTIRESAKRIVPWRAEFRIRAADGNTKWISGHSLPQREDDGSVLWHGSLEDVTERKFQQQELQVSQDHIRMLVSGVKDYAIFMLDTNGNITTWNQGAERLKGWTAAEIVGQHFSRFYSAEEVAAGKPQRELQIATAEGRYEDQGWRYRKDGSRFWADVVITPLRDDRGRQYGYAKVSRDMTERRRIEQAIKEDEARLAGVIGSAMDAIITTDEQQRITLFNPAAEIMFGRKASDVIGQSLEQFIPSRFRPAHTVHVREFGETHITRRKMSEMGSIFGLRSDGREFPIEASISHVEVGGQKLFTVILRDITERRKAEEELRQQARLMDLAPLIVRDMSGRIVYWSRGAEKMYGFRKAEALGKISHELLRSNFPQPLLEISRILVSEGSWEGEIEHKTREGAQIFVSSQWVLYRDADENPVRILEVNSDISERKRASARLLNSQSWNLLGPCPAASPTISTTFCWPSMAMPGWRSRICRRTTRCRKA